MRHKYRQQITMFFKVVLSYILYKDDFHFSSRSKRAYVLYAPFKIKDSCMQQCVFGCHLYTLDLLLAQSYLPRLLQKYGFIFCYFNQLIHLHKILMLGGVLECLCEFRQLAVVLKMFLQQMGWLINIYSHFQETKLVTILLTCNYDEIQSVSLSSNSMIENYLL